MANNQTIIPEGLYPRYRVTKTDGSPTDKGAKYFVLRYDSGGSDQVHIDACRVAIAAYATAVNLTHLEQVGKDLVKAVNQEPK